MEHWHLYMDETGFFEGTGDEVRRRKLGMLFLLVLDEIKTELATKLQKIYAKYYPKKYPHAKEEANTKNFFACMKEVIELISYYKIKLYYLQYKEDVYSFNQADGLSEEYLANRYYNMFLDGLEYITFLDTTTWGNEIQFSFFPCSRVTPINQDEHEKRKQYKQMGFHVFSPENPIEQGQQLATLMDSASLRAFLYKMLREYTIFFNVIGKREYNAIETIIASKSKDIFVTLVDNLVMILRAGIWNKNLKSLKRKIEQQITCSFEYSSNHFSYKNIILTYLNGDKIAALTEIIRQKDKLNIPYIKKAFDRLILILLNQAQFSLSELVELESIINKDIRNSKGNWDYIATILDYYDNFLSQLSEDEKSSKQFQYLVRRIYSHKLSIHNHRGEYTGAYQAAQKIVELQKDYCLSIEELREHIEIRNRMAVAFANMFEFEKSNKSLEEDIDFLLELKTKAQNAYKMTIKDVILGKLYGTRGQNYAFLAPFKPELFTKAEECFLKAKEEFTRPGDKHRQDMYLLHLYYDWQKIDNSVPKKGNELLQQLLAEPNVQEFLNNSSPENAKYKQFILHLLLKYHLDADVNIMKQFCEQFTVSRLKELFKDAADEHPFEFIFSYLGIMSIRCNRQKEARDYFAYALRIPPKGRRIEQPTLQAIRAQILARYGLELNKIGEEKEACNKMQEALKIMEQLGKHPEYGTILALQGDEAVGGWFKDAWNRLAKVNWKKDFDVDACQTFLKYFTFNYA